jgi:glucoamylase
MGGQSDAERRVAFLPAAVLGNGSLLATLSARGEVERLFWPHVYGPEHVRELRLALATPDEGGRRALDEPPFSWKQSYETGASILRTVVHDGRLELELVDLVDPDEPVLARRLRAAGESGDSLVVSCRPHLGGDERFGAAYVDPATQGLVFYSRDTALAVLTSPAPISAAVGRAGLGDWDIVEHRAPVAGELTVELGGEVALVAAFGSSAREAVERARAARDEGFESLERRRRERDGAALGDTSVAEHDGLGRRSLLVLAGLADRATGGVVAAPECDPEFLHSGGYGFVWPRDHAYAVLGLLAAGRAELAAAGLRWLARTQAPEGMWPQRSWTNGAAAPSWCPHQIDETGIVLFAYEAAWLELGDEALDRELWPSARAGAQFLVRFVDEETGLLLPSFDLWEQDDAQNTYASAAAVGGLRGAAALAERHEPALAETFREAARGIAAAIDDHLWSEAEGRYVRARLVGRDDLLGEPVPQQFRQRPSLPARTVRSVDPLDARLDSSLLGLAWPFAVVDPASARMRATAAAIEQGLPAPGGGLRRHEGDVYRGGNAWPLCTLWLGLYHRLLGDSARLDSALEWTRSRATPLGLLPEQSHRDGSPAWVLPLGWSHALYVLAVRPELRLVETLVRDAARGVGSPS